MKSHWRKLLSILPDKYERQFHENFFLKEHLKWEQANKPLPVSAYSKQQVLKNFQKKYSINTLVETGTYLGDTLYALSNSFDNLYSIELSHLFYKKAKERFKKFSNVHPLQGNSGEVLKALVPQLSEPALFWLDAHYSGGLTAKGDKECPIYEELAAIFASPFSHFILIDDARLFVGQLDYPTLNELKDYVRATKPFYTFSVENDCIRIIPA